MRAMAVVPTYNEALKSPAFCGRFSSRGRTLGLWWWMTIPRMGPRALLNSYVGKTRGSI